MPKKPKNNQLGLDLLEQGGTIHPIANRGDAPQLHFSMDDGQLYLGDSLAWLRTLEDSTVDLVFADPPYNIGKADWDVFQHHDEYLDWCDGNLQARIVSRNEPHYQFFHYPDTSRRLQSSSRRSMASTTATHAPICKPMNFSALISICLISWCARTYGDIAEVVYAPACTKVECYMMRANRSSRHVL